MYPEAPQFGVLRLATLFDVPRIGVVAVKGFRHSPVFQWERPYYENYPEDTLMSYRAMFAQLIKNPKYIVLTVSDSFDPDEGNKSSMFISPDRRAVEPNNGDSVIVGVASWRLELGSIRIGQFQNDKDSSVDFPEGLQRDKNQSHITAFDKLCSAAENNHFRDHSLMDMVVVHPAYWKHGHGTTLVRWGMRLADMDQVRQGVIAAEMGAKLYLGIGYTKLCDIQAIEAEDSPEKITNIIARYSPEVPREDGFVS